MEKINNDVFQRIEKKYLLSENNFNLLFQKIEPYMSIDKFGLHTICNIYYDTETFDIIRNSIEKPFYKEKLTIVKILDGSGNTIDEFTPKKTFQSVLISSPDLKVDAAYQLYSQDTKTADFTLTKTIMSISETGEEVTVGGFGQPVQGSSLGMKPGKQDGEMPTVPEGERPSGFKGERHIPDGTSGATQQTDGTSGETQENNIPGGTEDSEATV